MRDQHDARVERFRLRGLVGEVERTFVVPAGGGTVGSAPDNDIAVAVRGVSRCHARIELDEEGLAIEDLGSKNGMLVNDLRTARSSIRPGDRIQLGPVHLTLEALDADDAEIGLALAAVALPPPTVLGTTHLSRLGPAAAAWVALAEGFAARALGRAAGHLGPAVAHVVDEAGARAGALIEWDGTGRASVLAAAGAIGQLPEASRLTARAEHGTTWSADDGGMALGFVSQSGGGWLALALWGVVGADEPFCSVLRLLAGLVATQRAPGNDPESTDPELAKGLRFPTGYVPGRSPVMKALYDQLANLAPVDIPVVLLGETGVGKEPLARILHDSSPRRAAPFVALNCAAIAPDQLEAELFGIGQGAATGVSPRLGMFREAHGGTLFLDEVGELPVALQAKLLRVLQEKELRPIGAAPVTIDVRLVSATNRDLPALIENEAFRSDLYYRLSGAALAVPPLRARSEDLVGLIGHFVQELASQLGKPVRGVSMKALRLLEAHPWPGNVRQLENEVRRAVLECPRDAFVDSGMLSAEIRQSTTGQGGTPSLEPGDQPLVEQLMAIERYILERALEKADGNKSQAAKQLGVSRNGLAYRFKRLAMET